MITPVRAAGMCAAGVLLAAAIPASPAQRLPSEPRKQFGASVTGAFEPFTAMTSNSGIFGDRSTVGEITAFATGGELVTV